MKRFLPIAVGAIATAASVAWIERDHLRFAPPLARVERVDGGARVAGQPLAVGAALGRGDRIETNGGGRASVALPNRTRFDLDGNGAVEILRLAPVELWLHKGAITVDGAALVYTREATVALRGGSCAVAVTADRTTVTSSTARVHVEGLHRTSVDLAPGRRIEIVR